ncbi:hypothetical protein CASFOL_036527 [Castilleja foliolosa]|uniref:Peptidase A1 domain-containing protein n=1 Tax=Castilleja foliolosa TaxID=1961234 RepID=A0ABD3BVT1_9LAMI
MMLYLKKISLSYILSISINIWVSLAQDRIPPLITRLTYYNSENSPYCNPMSTTKDIADFELMSSISRALYLTSRNASSWLQLTDIETQLTGGEEQNGFLAKLLVGSLNVDQLVYMDTGSNLLWINCGYRYNVPTPLFDPSSSDTYNHEDCQSSDGICNYSGNVKIECNNVGNCSYLIRYGGGSSSEGNLARETFTFGMRMSSQSTIKNIVFGCAKKVTGNIRANGVLGLGNLRLSLVSQNKASKFSYCIGNISDRSYAYNTLLIGNSIELWGAKTPLIVEDKNYINLEGIKINGYQLKFDPQIFKRNSYEYTGGMVVDTGSTFSFIPGVVLSDFEAIIRDVIDYELELDLDSIDTIKYKEYTRLCYRGVVSIDLIGFPSVELQFQDNAVMELMTDNIFQQTEEDIFCLAIRNYH